MQRLPRSHLFIKMGLDGLMLVLAFLVAAFLSKGHALQSRALFQLTGQEAPVLCALLAVWYVTSHSVHLYDEFRTSTLNAKLVAMLKAVLIQALAAVVILFAIKSAVLSRFFVFVYTGLITAFLLAEKTAVRPVLLAMKKKPRSSRTFVILGLNRTGWSFAQMIMARPHLGYRFLGFFDDRPRRYAKGYCLGTMNRLEDFFNSHRVDEVFIALPLHDGHRVNRLISTCEKHVAEVRIIPDVSRVCRSRLAVNLLGGMPILSVRANPLENTQNRLFKAGLDLLLTLVLLLTVFSWLWPIIALAIRLDSKGPVVFKQARYGKKNRVFVCYKFRTMRADCLQNDARGHLVQATRGDPRTTRVGRILRRLSLDELPQFLNVLKWDMSIVGPRPHPVPLHLDSRGRVNHYMVRQLVKPGITGWAQVHGLRGETRNIAQMQERIDHDLWYIENWSLWLDLRLILASIIMTIKGDPNAY